MTQTTRVEEKQNRFLQYVKRRAFLGELLTFFVALLLGRICIAGDIAPFGLAFLAAASISGCNAHYALAGAVFGEILLQAEPQYPAVCACVLYYVMHLLWNCWSRKNAKLDQLFLLFLAQAALLPVLVRHGGREARFTCLLDTGNGLRDPATGRPVLVVWRQALLPVLPAVEPEQLRPIRYRSLGTESGTLLCFNAGQVTVDGVAYENQPVAIAPSPLSEGMGYAALWNGKERGHGTQRTETEAA